MPVLGPWEVEPNNTIQPYKLNELLADRYHLIPLPDRSIHSR